MRDIVASQSGHEVISLQKMDSLLLFLNVTEKLRRFLRRNAGGIWIKIHLNPKLGFWHFLLKVSRSRGFEREKPSSRLDEQEHKMKIEV
jgi:hypothetical protein